MDENYIGFPIPGMPNDEFKPIKNDKSTVYEGGIIIFFTHLIFQTIDTLIDEIFTRTN